MTTEQRHIRTGPSPISETSPPPSIKQSSASASASGQASSSTGTGTGTGTSQSQTSVEASWKKRVSTACLACKKSKRKCSGTPPCTNCITFARKCIFDESLDQRRRVAAKRTADELSYHRDLLNDLFTLVREADSLAADALLDLIRERAGPEEVREFINETLSGLSGRVRMSGDRDGPGSSTLIPTEESMSGSVSTSTPRTSGSGSGSNASIRDAIMPDKDKIQLQETISKLEDVKDSIKVEGAEPSFRSKVMDLHYLCDEAPIKVPAKPWTDVTDDDDLVSHLVSLYFTWDYPVHAFLDRDVFLKYMVAPGGEGEFCSAFLVNALLSNACVSCYHFPFKFRFKFCIWSDLLLEATNLILSSPQSLGWAC